MNNINVLSAVEAGFNPVLPKAVETPPEQSREVFGIPGYTEEEIAKVVCRIEEGGIDIQSIFPEWRLIGSAFADTLGESGRKLFHRVCRTYPDYISVECDQQFDHYLKSNVSEFSIASFMHYSCDFGSTVGKPGINEADAESGQTENQVNPENVYPGNFPDSIFPLLPEFLHKVVKVADTRDERDMLLLGALGVFSGVLPNIFGIYDNRSYNPNLYVLIIADAAAGKGKLVLCRGLAEPIHVERQMGRRLRYQIGNETSIRDAQDESGTGTHEQIPFEGMLFIPANISSSGIAQLLSNSGDSGIIFETEGDTVSFALKTDWGNYSDLLRKAFQHEPVTLYRKTNRESISIKKPQLSVILSGTPNQVKPLFGDVESGLFSRFIFYTMKGGLVWKDVFKDQDEGGLDRHFDNLGEEFYPIYEKFRDLEQRIQIKIKKDQAEQFNQVFSNALSKYSQIQGPEYAATVKRLGLVLFRVCLILTALRIKDPAKCKGPLFCLESDFQIALKIGKVLIRHSILVFSQLPEVIKPQRRKNLVERFYDGLPVEFTRKQYLELAKGLGILEKTADAYVKSFLSKKQIHRDQHNKYQKAE